MNLFESKEAARKRKRMEARKVERAVERVIDNLADKIRNIERERDKLWKDAKLKLQSGQKMEAARVLKMYKSKDFMITRLDRQKTFVQHQLDMITGARDMQVAMGALKDMATGMDISVDNLEDNLASIDFATADISEINKSMDKAFEKSMSQLDRESEELNNTEIDENLMNALELETAGEISHGIASAEGSNVSSSASQGSTDISAGVERLKKILGEKQ